MSEAVTEMTDGYAAGYSGMLELAFPEAPTQILFMLWAYTNAFSTK